MTSNTIPDWPQTYRLRRALDVAHIDEEAVAEYIGCHPNTVRNYLSGRTKPRRVVLRAWSDLTGVPLWWLEGTEPKSRPDIPPVILRDQRHRRPHTLRVVSHTRATGPPVTDEHLMDVA